MEVGEPEKKKKRQESKDERLDRLIDRARARHKLARLLMETIFLVSIFGDDEASYMLS